MGRVSFIFASMKFSSVYAASLSAARARAVLTPLCVCRKALAQQEYSIWMFGSHPSSMLLATHELVPGCVLEHLDIVFPAPMPGSTPGALLTVVDILLLRLFLAFCH